MQIILLHPLEMSALWQCLVETICSNFSKPIHSRSHTAMLLQTRLEIMPWRRRRRRMHVQLHREVLDNSPLNRLYLTAPVLPYHYNRDSFGATKNNCIACTEKLLTVEKVKMVMALKEVKGNEVVIIIFPSCSCSLSTLRWLTATDGHCVSFNYWSYLLLVPLLCDYISEGGDGSFFGIHLRLSWIITLC